LSCVLAATLDPVRRKLSLLPAELAFDVAQLARRELAASATAWPVGRRDGGQARLHSATPRRPAAA
jgi:hypothetical protein